MGNAISDQGRAGRVILPDGTIHAYDKPLTVAELMLEYPQQVVIQLLDQKKQTPMNMIPLPADVQLETNKVYMMLPLRRGKPPAAALTSQEARILLLKSKSLLSSSTGFIPFFAKICAAGTRERPHERKDKQEEATKPDYFGDVLLVEHRPEFLSRQISGKGWKPSLDTITEKIAPSKVRHWWF